MFATVSFGCITTSQGTYDYPVWENGQMVYHQGTWTTWVAHFPTGQAA